jgi:hypothetical protein
MSHQTRWTVRNVDPAALEMLNRVREGCGLTTGELLSDALRKWYDQLPEIEEDYLTGRT